ncbi:MAG TPA: FHA domain-containing protein, partial [Anaerolineaceae bacterium]|nr:FHA domain-containing protein [Anaerolineaceae bacterium]
LRVVEPGGDPHLRSGMYLSLSPVTRLGSERDNDIVLQDRFVSSHHARLQWDGVDWWLTDLDSRNGTTLDGGQVAAQTPQRVAPGGSLRIGDVTFELME